MVLMRRMCLHIRLGDDFAVLPHLICGDWIMELGTLALLLPRAFQRALDCENQEKETKVMTWRSWKLC